MNSSGKDEDFIEWVFYPFRQSGPRLRVFAVNAPNRTLCEFDGHLFKRGMTRKIKTLLDEMYGEDKIPKYLVDTVWRYICVTMHGGGGAQIYRLSLPLTLPTLLELHVEHDGADISNWIKYPFIM